MIKIYLCGGVRKSSDDKKIVWSEEDRGEIRDVLGEVKFLDPQTGWEGLGPLENFGCDLNDIKNCDFVMVDARQKRGIGIGAEMAIAKLWEKPVVTVCPANSHFRRDIEYYGTPVKGWIHPFLFSLSDKVVETPKDAASWVKEFLESPGKVKDQGIFDEAMDAFRKKGGERK